MQNRRKFMRPYYSSIERNNQFLLSCRLVLSMSIIALSIFEWDPNFRIMEKDICYHSNSNMGRRNNAVILVIAAAGHLIFALFIIVIKPYKLSRYDVYITQIMSNLVMTINLILLFILIRNDVSKLYQEGPLT